MNEEERAKAALEFLTLSEVLEWSGMTEEDALAFLLYHGAIRIPDEVFELKEEDGQDL
jgi:hypothetical protein